MPRIPALYTTAREGQSGRGHKAPAMTSRLRLALAERAGLTPPDQPEAVVLGAALPAIRAMEAGRTAPLDESHGLLAGLELERMLERRPSPYHPEEIRSNERNRT